MGDNVSDQGTWPGGFNTVVVAGPGYPWSPGSLLSIPAGGVIGYLSPGNQLVVTNGGFAYNGHAYMGLDNNGPSCSGPVSNAVRVAGSGSVWCNAGNLYLGYDASTNQLTITTGGSVIASNAYVGYATNSVGNQIAITNGNLSVINALSSGVLDMRRGTRTFNGGSVNVNQLFLTNAVGTRMIFTGGTLTSP